MTPNGPCSRWNGANWPESPQAEVAELARIYESKGLPPDLSRYVAEQLTARDPLQAHAEAELGIDPE